MGCVIERYDVGPTVDTMIDCEGNDLIQTGNISSDEFEITNTVVDHDRDRDEFIETVISAKLL